MLVLPGTGVVGGGWAGAGMLGQRAGLGFPGSYIQPGFRAGCRGFLCRSCLDYFIAGKWWSNKAW